MSRSLSLRLDLLDRQIVDADDIPVGRADDLEIDVRDGVPQVTALLTGAQAIGERIGGRRGRLMARVARRLRAPQDQPGPAAIPIDAVEEIDLEITLRLPLRDIPHVAGLEHWLARHLIGPLPRSGDARE